MHNKNSVNNIVISLYEEKKKIYIYIYIYYTNHNTTAK